MWLAIDLDQIGHGFLYVTCISFWALVITLNIQNYLRKRRIRNEEASSSSSPQFDQFMEKLKKMAADAGAELQMASVSMPMPSQYRTNLKKEETTFQWRHGGKMNEVRIVIDPALETEIPGTIEDFDKMVKEGNMGRYEDLVNDLAKPDTRQKIDKIEEFRFSTRSVQQLRLAGMSPDELVAKMLKASGRMD